MSEQQNIETIQEMYEAFGRADVASIVAKLTDDVKRVSHFDTIVPWSGDFSGTSNFTIPLWPQPFDERLSP